MKLRNTLRLRYVYIGIMEKSGGCHLIICIALNFEVCGIESSEKTLKVQVILGLGSQSLTDFRVLGVWEFGILGN